jgi:hypothetical protein
MVHQPLTKPQQPLSVTTLFSLSNGALPRLFAEPAEPRGSANICGCAQASQRARGEHTIQRKIVLQIYVQKQDILQTKRNESMAGSKHVWHNADFVHILS